MDNDQHEHRATTGRSGNHGRPRLDRQESFSALARQPSRDRHSQQRQKAFRHGMWQQEILGVYVAILWRLMPAVAQLNSRAVIGPVMQLRPILESLLGSMWRRVVFEPGSSVRVECKTPERAPC